MGIYIIASKVKKLLWFFCKMIAGGEKTMSYEKSKSLPVALQMQAYIRAHLLEPMTSSDIAKSIGYSQYHAARLFQKILTLLTLKHVNCLYFKVSRMTMKNFRKLSVIAWNKSKDSIRKFTVIVMQTNLLRKCS